MNRIDAIDSANSAMLAIDRAHQVVCFLYEVFELMDKQDVTSVLFGHECKRHSEFPAIAL